MGQYQEQWEGGRHVTFPEGTSGPYVFDKGVVIALLNSGYAQRLLSGKWDKTKDHMAVYDLLVQVPDKTVYQVQVVNRRIFEPSIQDQSTQRVTVLINAGASPIAEELTDILEAEDLTLIPMPRRVEVPARP